MLHPLRHSIADREIASCVVTMADAILAELERTRPKEEQP
jgi:hypothetical protein